MTPWETAFIVGVLVAFFLFMAVVAYGAWCTSCIRRPKQSKGEDGAPVTPFSPAGY